MFRWGLSSVSTDCDDEDAQNSPDMEENCDGRDNDCDGELSTEELDQDGDGYVVVLLLRLVVRRHFVLAEGLQRRKSDSLSRADLVFRCRWRWVWARH